MGRQSQTNLNKPKGSFAGPLVGALFTVAWVVGSAAAFGLVVGFFDQTQPEELRQTAANLAWPFIAIALGVPFMVFVWFGGYAALARLGELRSHLGKLGQYARDFENLAEVAEEVNSNLSAASVSVSEAANAISSNFDEYEQNISPQISAYFESIEAQMRKDEGLEEPPQGMFSMTPNVEQEFQTLYDEADRFFYSIVSTRNGNPGRGKRQLVVTRGGWNKADIVKQLANEDWVTKELAEVLEEIFKAEQSSRRWGRQHLKIEGIQLLRKSFDELLPKEPPR